MSAGNTPMFTFAQVRKALLCFAAATPMAVAALSAHAQVPVTQRDVPTSATPERTEQRFYPQQSQPALPRGAEATGIEAPAQVPVGNQMGAQLAKPFTLRNVVVEGSTVYPAGTFEKFFAAKTGKQTTLNELRAIARQITTQYRTDGYVLSQAVIPSQTMQQGVVKIRVVEGFVDNVIVASDRPDLDKRGLVKAYGEQISAVRPLNTKTLERYMLLVNDLPGVQGRAVLRPSPSTFGAADLVIEVSHKPVDLSFTSDNRGNKFIGPYQQQLTWAGNSVLGMGDRTTVRGINSIPTNDLHFFDVQHEQQLDDDGTRLTALAAFTTTQPGDTLRQLELRGRASNYAVTVSHPFLRSRTENFTGRFTAEARSSENTAFKQRLSNDRVRALRLGGSYDVADSWDGINLLNAQVSQGVNWLDSTPEGPGRTNPQAEEDFTKLTIDMSRLHSLPGGFSILASASGQLSSDPLLASEQFSLGGVGFGQAYDSGELSGDEGISGKLELRYGHATNYDYLDSYQLYGYYDIGTVHIKEALTGVDSNISLASLGAGVRANFNNYIYGYLEVGLPLTRDVGSEGDKNARVFYSITGRF